MKLYDILPKLIRKGEEFDIEAVESWNDVNLGETLRAGNVPQFPHCDTGVLHAPGECEYCDKHEEWQILRHVWGINYTGHKDPTKQTCPAEQSRSLASIEAWGGNVPTQNGQYAPVVDPEELAATTERLLDLLAQIQASQAVISSDQPDLDS